jgi:hypothetical protein
VIAAVGFPPNHPWRIFRLCTLIGTGSEEMETKKIEEIECTYTTHFSFKTSELEVDWSKVWYWEVKYGYLRYILDDGTEGEEYLVESSDTVHNIAMKWPSATMVLIDGNWVNENEVSKEQEVKE